MNNAKTVNFFDENKVSFKAYKQYLKHQTDRKKVLNETASYLLNLKHPEKRMLAFKNNFFETFARELADNSGCSEVLPDHLRIQTKDWEQFLIEIMNAARLSGYLGKMTIKRLARILVCILDTNYDQAGMINRLKNKNPQYEEIYKQIKDLSSHIEKNI
ncbi:hypothetical protein [uncultured Parabacteroides sp.]|jgi:hypothetical protein|uniref:hypothetical protein n=1 Tax=uncultured Parabacteroides sp. TaxID=512312 RepID=UPI0025F1F768|nr:hypothetical protein [uncultured Parabacteroides sp.]